MNIRIWLLLFGIGCTCTNVKSQESVPKPLPPGVNSVAIMNNIETPVSLYTGVPNISIPIYTISVNNFKIPISISYQASGIKVAQEATSVGLGWSLNAGGSISRIIHGADDLYSTDITRYNGKSVDENSINDYFEYLANGGGQRLTQDFEPDIFYYNFCGYSGKFILGENGKGCTFNASNFDISVSRDYITFINDHGIEFLFQKGTMVRTCSEKVDYLLNIDQEENFSPISDKSYSKYSNSSWNLISIKLPTNEEIKFNYTGAVQNYRTPINVSSSFSTLLPIDMLSDEAKKHLRCRTFADNETNYSYSFQEYINDKIIGSIVFPNGKLVFHSSNREDLNGVGKKIDSINVYNIKKDTPIHKYSLKYSYFNENKKNFPYKYLHLRLKLEEIQKDNLPSHKFFYNSLNLPSKTSPAHDHWGYFNEETNLNGNNERLLFGSFAPRFIQSNYNNSSNSVSGLKYILEGANRTSCENSTKASILEKIKLPTGGERTFEYELNTYSDTKVSHHNFQPPSGAKESACECTGNIILDTKKITKSYTEKSLVKEFSLMAQQEVEFTASAFMPIGGRENDEQCLVSENTLIATVYNKETDEALYSFNYAENGQLFKKELPAGDYRIHIYPHSCATLSLMVSYNKTSISYMKELPAGGLRVKKIYDNATTSYYKYVNKYGCSTGKLQSIPEYIWVTFAGKCTDNGDPELSDLKLMFLTRFVNSTKPLVGFNGVLGYDQVSKYSIINSDTICETVHFMNEIEKEGNYLIPNLPKTPCLSNGLMKLIEYKKNNIIVKKIRNVYSQTNIEKRKCFKFSTTYGQAFYYYNREWWHQDSSITESFYKQGINNENISFSYNSANKSIYEQRKINSKGELQVIRSLYNVDYPEHYKNMIDKNIINKTIRREVLVGNKLIDGKVFQYSPKGQIINTHIFDTKDTRSDFSNKSHLLPDGYFLNETFDYNSQFKLKEYSSNHEKYVFHYIHNNQYPCAKIQNMEYSLIEVNTKGIKDLLESLEDFDDLTGIQRKLDKNKQDELIKVNQRIREAAPSDALIYTYTYDPLIGMTSECDPRGRCTFYTYDSFGRLKQVLDHDGKVLKEYDYEYANASK